LLDFASIWHISLTLIDCIRVCSWYHDDAATPMAKARVTDKNWLSLRYVLAFA
jgi:hypothetical protein